MMSDHSQLMERAMGIIYPLIMIFGVYVVLNGHISPGHCWFRDQSPYRSRR